MATTVAQMNALSDRLDTLVDLVTQELNVELRQERKDAKGDTSLLAAIDKREADLRGALDTHKAAKAAYMVAKGAYKVKPTVMDTNYAKALGLAAELETVLGYYTDDSDKSKTDPKADEAKDEGKDKKEPKDDKAKGKTDTDDKADPKTDSDKEKAEGKDKKSEPETDPIMAAIAKLGADCAQRHDETTNAIEALKAGLLKPELAALLNTLDEATLNAILNRRELTPLGADLVNVLAAYTPEELKLMLANLAAVSDRAEKLRKVLPGGRKAKGEKDPK